MKPHIAILTALLLVPLSVVHAATIRLFEPLDYQVIQRTSPTAGTIRLRGTLTELDTKMQPAKRESLSRASPVSGSGCWHESPGVN